MLNKLKQEKFIGILRHIPVCQTAEVAKAMYQGGIRIFEVTFNPSDPETVDKVARQWDLIRESVGDDISLCAGTVVKKEYVYAAKKNGIECIVSPNADAGIITLTKELDMISMPGVYTPSEIVNAYECGADIVKIFPILPENINYLKTVVSPLSHIPFITTGGVNPETIPQLLKTGAIALAAGVSIIPEIALKNKDYKLIEENARLHMDAIRGCEQKKER